MALRSVLAGLLFAIGTTVSAQPCLRFDLPHTRYLPVRVLGTPAAGERHIEFEVEHRFAFENSCQDTVDIGRTGYLQGSFFAHELPTAPGKRGFLDYRHERNVHFNGNINTHMGEAHLWRWQAGFPTLRTIQYSVDSTMEVVSPQFGAIAYAEAPTDGSYRVLEADTAGFPVALGRVSTFTHSPVGEWLFFDAATGTPTQKVFTKLLRIYLNGVPAPDCDSVVVFLGRMDEEVCRWEQHLQFSCGHSIGVQVDASIDSIRIAYGQRTARSAILYPRMHIEESRYLFLLDAMEPVVEGGHGPAPIRYTNDYAVLWDWNTLIARYGSPVNHENALLRLQHLFGIRPDLFGLYNDTPLLVNPPQALLEQLVQWDEIQGVAQVVELQGELTYHSGVVSVYIDGNVPADLSATAQSLGFGPLVWRSGGIAELVWRGSVHTRAAVEAFNALVRRYPQLVMGLDWRVYHVELDD